MRVECIHLFSTEDESPGLSAKADQLVRAFALPSARFDQLSPSELKKAVGWSLVKAGWARNVRVPGSRLSVNFVLDNAALCVQFGNVARTYADLLKLQTMHCLGKTSNGFIAVPVLAASRIMGSNHAQFERLVAEIELFRETISMPIGVIGLGE